jgi:uncharacterized protein (TIGR03435 family)
MRTEKFDVLAVGILGSKSRIRERVERLLKLPIVDARGSRVGIVSSAGALIAILLIAAFAPRWIAFAQEPPQVRFDVASVKPNTTTERPDFQLSPNGRLTIRNAPLLMILVSAYNLPFQSQRLTGIAREMAGLRYDIEATAKESDFPPALPEKDREERMRALLISVLVDRFRMTIRRETKTEPVYAIMVGKNGPKLERSSVNESACESNTIGPYLAPNPQNCHTWTGGRGRGLHGQAVSMEDLALAVSNWSDRPVIDKSGIKGLFKIETRPWLPMQPGPPPAPGAKGEDGSELADLPTLFQVFEQLGLKLDPQKAPIDIYVVEHIEKPDAN